MRDIQPQLRKIIQNEFGLTTRGNKLNRLPSTELLHDAILKSVDLDIECQLVNCVHADTATLAISRLQKEKSFGIYANSSIYKKIN